MQDTSEQRRVSDQPDWLYLLREYYEMYRFLPAGGSRAIRAHQKQVREAISRLMRADPVLRDSPPASLPVTAHLRRALDEGRSGVLAPVARSLDAVRARLHWEYGYDKVPKGLARSYGYAEIAGPNGPVPSAEVILGLVLFAPGCTYPAHAHHDITESYIVLSGSVSENDYGVYAPGSSIYNPPGHAHRITVSDMEPALLAYAWIGNPAVLAGNKMVLGVSRPRG
ncbi:dimethylsulfonioproprionate lyase family protein [Thalassovita sp.]|uniref:dimethylsulfonioproprionate lyase family protein n=1 Tax=Thalassovita sp. TaxID=1979401 RepID=UPI0029DE6AA5|nr:dimethylsulfonioproprionate lyase family protein [Thalassovita sp.]